MDTIIIFSAKYLYLVVVAVAVMYIALQSRSTQKQILLFAILALPFAYILAKVGSFLYNDPRPFVVEHFTPLIAHSPDNGFPSDHTLLTAAISSVLYPSSRYISVVLWVLTLATGVSRVAAGVHHPIDIAGSMAIAVIAAYTTYLFLKKDGDA